MIRTRYDARLTRLPMAAAFDLRGTMKSITRATTVLQLSLPKSRHDISAGPDSMELVQLAPNRVVILAPIEQETAIAAKLAKAFEKIADADFALISDMLVTFALSGSGAEDVLRQGAPLDLSQEAFPGGEARATDLWSTSVILLRGDAVHDGFRIVIERSFADYIEDWLTVANGGLSELRPGVMSNPPASYKPA